MLAILNSLNAHNFPIFQTILMTLVLKFMVHRALSNKTYLSLGLLSAVFINSTRKTAVCLQNIKISCLNGPSSNKISENLL